MDNSEFERSRRELEIISEAGEKFYRTDQRMTLLYRLHNLPHRRVEGWEFVDQDFVLNLTIGDKYVLGQHAEDDPRSGHNCYFGHFGSNVDDKGVSNDDNTDGSDQNESLGLFGDCYSKYVDTVGHCQVERDKSGLWIKDLGSEHGTFLNGVKLKTNVVHLLKNGDLISLGFSYDVEKSWMLEIGHYWVFKVYEVPVSEFEHRKSVATAAMGTSVILDTILSNLNYKELKLCRVVSPLWDEEARRKLRSRTRLVFPSSNLIANNHRNYSSDDSELFNSSYASSSEGEARIEYAGVKLSALQNTGIWSISFEENNSKFEFPIERLPFFKNILVNTKFTRTELDFLVEGENVTSFFKSILSWSQLRQVTFNSKLFQVGYEFEQDFGACASVSVQKLIFNERQSNYSKILQFFPNTTEIVLSGSAVTNEFLNENYENQLDGVKFFEISNNKNGDGDHSTEICKMSPLICALSESMQLTRLEIADLNLDLLDCDLDTGCGCVQGLFDILSKFKNSLHNLKLGLYLHGNSLIKFPEMKMLRYFTLKIKKATASSSQIFASGFGSEKFPILDTLQVTINGLGETLLKGFVEGNFASQSEFGNNSVQMLCFMFPNAELQNKYSKLAKNNFQEIFPNCVDFVFFCAYNEDEDL